MEILTLSCTEEGSRLFETKEGTRTEGKEKSIRRNPYYMPEINLSELDENLRKCSSLDTIKAWINEMPIVLKSKAIKTLNYFFSANLIEANFINSTNEVLTIKGMNQKSSLLQLGAANKSQKDVKISCTRSSISLNGLEKLVLTNLKSNIELEWDISSRAITNIAVSLLSSTRSVDSIPGALFEILLINKFFDAENNRDNKLWNNHDYYFNKLTRNFDDNRDRSGSYRYGKNNIWLESLDMKTAQIPLEYHKQIGLPPYSQRITLKNCSLLSEQSLVELYSRAFSNLHAREMPQGWSEDKYKPNRIHRPYPSAGGIYEQSFYLIKTASTIQNGVKEESTVQKFSCSNRRFVQLTPNKELEEKIFQYMRGCWVTEKPPAYILLIVGNYASLSFKYSHIAYRLMLINAGCALSSFYQACKSMNIGCCPGGTGPSQAVQELLELADDEEVPVLEVGFGTQV